MLLEPANWLNCSQFQKSPFSSWPEPDEFLRSGLALAFDSIRELLVSGSGMCSPQKSVATQ